MSPSGAEVIRQIKSQIEEVDPSEVNAAASNGNGSRPVLIDVRESDEWDAGPEPEPTVLVHQFGRDSG